VLDQREEEIEESISTPPDRSPEVSDCEGESWASPGFGEWLQRATIDDVVAKYTKDSSVYHFVRDYESTGPEILYVPAFLPGGSRRDFLVDSGASKSVIDESVYLSLPEPRPVLNPTNVKFQVANGAAMRPKGVIHAPVTFDDGVTHVKVHLPLFVCSTGSSGKCILGSDAGIRLGLTLDWAKKQLHFDSKYARLPLNCTAGRPDRPEPYTAKTLQSVVVKAYCYAGVTVGTRHGMPPRSWRSHAYVEAVDTLWEERGLLVVPGMIDFGRGPDEICLVNMNEYDVVIRKGTALGQLQPGAEEKGNGYESLASVHEVVSEEPGGLESMFNIVCPRGEQVFSAQERQDLYNIFGLQKPEDPFGSEPPLSTLDSDEDSMDEMHYPDVEPSKESPQALSDPLNKLLARSKDTLTSDQMILVEKLLKNMETTFMDPSTPLVGTSAVVHYVDTGEQRPIRIPPRRVDPGKREVIEKEILKMLEAGVIRESSSPWSSPIVLVKKSDGTTRFCIDYRKLNEVTRKNSYPLPRIDDHLEALKGNSWFCTLDLASGYWQIQMYEGDKEKTAFASHMGLYEFNVMPFGLTNAPATFQALMEEVLKGLIGKSCLLYLDDIIVYGRTFEEVYQNLQDVMKRLKKYNLKLKAKKCSLFQRSVKFLGHVVSEKGIACNPETVQAVQDLGQPRDKTGVRSILGLGNYYRRFIKDYCLITHPLQLLTHLDVDFYWTEEHETSLQKLKDALCSAPVLAYPDMSEGKTFIVDTDASDYQIGGVLSQEQDGEERVIMYASKGFHGSQLRWCTTRRELWGIVYMVTKAFKYYLNNRDFLVRTDHASLTWMHNFPRNSNDTICRWIFYLSEVGRMKVVYRPGKKHGNADAMSRLRPVTRDCPIPICKDPGHRLTKAKTRKEDPAPKAKVTKKHKKIGVDLLKQPKVIQAVNRLQASMEEGYSDLVPSLTAAAMREAQQKDSSIKRFTQLFEENVVKPSAKLLAGESQEVRTYCVLWEEMRMIEGVLYRVGVSEHDPLSMRVVVPFIMRQDIMERLHEGRWAGHPGMSKMKHVLFSRYYWPRAGKDVEAWVRCCERCAVSKKGPHRRKHPLIQEISGAPFHRVAFDIIGPLPETNDGYRYILVMVDYFTKWAEAYPLTNRYAVDIADVMMSRWFVTYGVPLKLHCDNAREFRGQVMTELKSILGIKGTFTSGYRAQSNGMCERTNGTLETMIRSMVGERRNEWDKALPYVVGAYRSTPHATTGFTPNMLVFAREANIPSDIMYGSTLKRVQAPEFGCLCYHITEMRKTMIRCFEIARENAGVAAKRQRRIHDEGTAPRHFKPGDFVWFFEKRLSSRPLCMGWTGKFVVTKKLGPANYRIQRVEGGKSKVVHVDNLRLHNDQSSTNWIKERRVSPDKAVQTEEIPQLPEEVTPVRQTVVENPEKTLTGPPLRRSARLAKKRQVIHGAHLHVKLPVRR